MLTRQKHFYQVLETLEKNICSIPDFHRMTGLSWRTHMVASYVLWQT